MIDTDVLRQIGKTMLEDELVFREDVPAIIQAADEIDRFHNIIARHEKWLQKLCNDRDMLKPFAPEYHLLSYQIRLYEGIIEDLKGEGLYK